MAFDAVRYAYDVSDPSSVTSSVSEMPEIYLIVGKWAYFADSSGYLMIVPIETVHGFVVDMTGDVRYVAVNAKYADESEFGALVPGDLLVRNETVAAALTALHDSIL